MTRYSGLTKVLVCRRLAEIWEDVADHCEVPLHVRERFDKGREPQGVWEYLERQEQLARLPVALRDLECFEALKLLDAGDVPVEEGATSHQSRITVDVLSTVTFDLTDIKKAIDTRLDSISQGVVAFSVPYGDGMFVTNVCEYIASFNDGMMCKEPFALTADISSPDEVIHSITAYRAEELQSADAIFSIRAEGVPADTVAAFLTGLSSAMGSLPRRLILLVSVSWGAAAIPNVHALPAPRVTREDLSRWFRDRLEILRVHADRNLPASIAGRWADVIAELAHFGAGLNLRRVYDELQQTLTQFRDDPDAFTRFLHEGN